MPGGRDQIQPMERLVRLLSALENAGPAGIGCDELTAVCEYGGSEESLRRQLNRDLNHLTAAGWDIRNVSPPGLPAHHVLYARDTRLRVELTREQQAELVRVARQSGMREFADYVGSDDGPTEQDGSPAASLTAGGQPPPSATHSNLTWCVYAANRRCIIQFIYNRRPRAVHPRVVQPGPSGWYLVGREDGQDAEKYFVTERMSNLVVDTPGTAKIAAEPSRIQLDPLTWQVDPPTEVVVATTADQLDLVRVRLGTPSGSDSEGERVVLTYTVTHRAAFRYRLFLLGNRVRVLEPDEVRAELVDALERIAAAS